MRKNIPLSKETLEYIEDAVINKLQPIYLQLQLARDGKSLTRSDIDGMLDQIEGIVKWIRNHRPKSKRI